MSVLSGLGLLLLTAAMLTQADVAAPVTAGQSPDPNRPAAGSSDGSGAGAVVADEPDGGAASGGRPPGSADRPPGPVDPSTVIRVRELEREDLLGLPVLALTILGMVSLGVGWYVAGRMLRPVQVMTERLRGISDRNVHERLALPGPRDELKDLADTVDGLLGRLDLALEAQKRFVANAAHELRTPLTVEHALLEESLIDPDATLESFRENFDRLLGISAKRARLLESLLMLAAGGRGMDRSKPVDLATVVHQAMEARRGDLAGRRLELLTRSEPAPVRGDPALVERLVTNLCDNAIQHNRPGGRIEVSTGRVEARSVVTVANSGRRLRPDQVERLLEPFQRLERTADRDHHGLGLSIVRTIATAHGATLEVAARPTGGLTVTVAFPVVPPDRSR